LRREIGLGFLHNLHHAGYHLSRHYPGDLRCRQTQASTGGKIIDAIVVRPIALVVAFAGTGLYLGTTPLTGLTGTSEKTAKYLMRRPWRYTSGRPPGVWK
jgi:hypothetical protein